MTSDAAFIESTSITAAPTWTLLRLLSKFFTSLGFDDAYYFCITLALYVALGVSFYAGNFLLKKKPVVKPDCILITGPRGSGKSSLFMNLQQGYFVRDIPSGVDHEGKFIPIGVAFTGEQEKAAASLRFIDCNSPAKLRKLIPSAFGVIIVINSTQDVEDCVDSVLDVLTNTEVVRRKVPILIACGHSDVGSGKSSLKIHNELIKLIDSKRRVRQDLDQLLRQFNKDPKQFSSFGMHPCHISFDSISCARGDEMGPILRFVESVL